MFGLKPISESPILKGLGRLFGGRANGVVTAPAVVPATPTVSAVDAIAFDPLVYIPEAPVVAAAEAPALGGSAHAHHILPERYIVTAELVEEAAPRQNWFSRLRGWLGRSPAASAGPAESIVTAELVAEAAPRAGSFPSSMLEALHAPNTASVSEASARMVEGMSRAGVAQANAAASERMIEGMSQIGRQAMSAPAAAAAVEREAAATVVATAERAGGIGRSIKNFFSLGRSPTLGGIVDGFQGVPRETGGIAGGFAYIGSKIGGGTRAVMDAPGKALTGARSGMTKFAIGAGVVAAGAYVLSALRESQQNAAMNKAMDKEIEAMKGPELPPVLGADGMVPNQPMPQMAMPEMPAMPPAPVQPAALDPNVQAMANQPFDLPPVSEPVAAASAAPAAEKEDTTFRDRIKAERGDLAGRPQPFVAPKSSLAEAVMSSKDTVVPTLTA